MWMDNCLCAKPPPSCPRGHRRLVTVVESNKSPKSRSLAQTKSCTSTHILFAHRSACIQTCSRRSPGQSSRCFVLLIYCRKLRVCWVASRCSSGDPTHCIVVANPSLYSLYHRWPTYSWLSVFDGWLKSVQKRTASVHMVCVHSHSVGCSLSVAWLLPALVTSSEKKQPGIFFTALFLDTWHMHGTALSAYTLSSKCWCAQSTEAYSADCVGCC